MFQTLKMRLRNTERKNYDEKGLENLIWYQARVKKYANGLQVGKPKVKRSKKISSKIIFRNKNAI